MIDPRVLAYSDSRVYSGAEALFVAVCGGLVGSGIAVRCTFAAENRELAQALERAGIPSEDMVAVRGQPLRLAGLWLWSPWARRRVRRLLEDEQHDVLLVNLPSFEYGGTPLLAQRRKRRRPSVGLVHIHHLPKAVGMRAGTLRGLSARVVARRLGRMLTDSPAAAPEIARDWGIDPRRIGPLVMPRPSLQRAPRNEARTQLGLPPDASMITLLGRVSSLQKGHDIFIDAAQIVLRTRPDTLFVIAGSGPDSAATERALAQRGMGAAVLMLGHVDPGMVLSATDLVAFPSRFEGLPLAALEAAAIGRPGIAADVDGLRVLWPARWRVPAGDAERLAAGLIALLDGSETSLVDGLRELRDAALRVTTDDCSTQVLEAIRAVHRR